jgi:hypothetical protein
VSKYKYHKRMFENIYDLIKGGKFEEEAKRELKKFTNPKEISWNGDNNTIDIGKHFTIKLIKHY